MGVEGCDAKSRNRSVPFSLSRPPLKQPHGGECPRVSCELPVA